MPPKQKKKPSEKKPPPNVASDAPKEESSLASLATYQSNPGIVGTDFDPSVTYMDRYVEDDDFTLSGDIQVHMDKDLRDFLFKAARTSHIYLDSMLAPNGIRTYTQFKEFAVDTQAFQDLDHVYLKLGPNALGQGQKQTERLLMLGHYIATGTVTTTDVDGNKSTQPVTIFDPVTHIFRPEAFDIHQWHLAFNPLRRHFGARYDKASRSTFAKYRGSLRLAPETVRSGYGTVTRATATDVPPEIASTPGLVNVSAIEGSSGSESSQRCNFVHTRKQGHVETRMKD